MRRAGSGGEDQLAALGEAQTVLAPVVLDHQLAPLAQQLLARGAALGKRNILRVLIFRDIFVRHRAHIQMITVLINVCQRRRAYNRRTSLCMKTTRFAALCAALLSSAAFAQS